MHDYSNMPTIAWHDGDSLARVKMQILHQEPAILEMPGNFQYTVEAATDQCRRDEEKGVFYDCGPEAILTELASLNQMPALKDLIKPCVDSGSRLDLDEYNGRLIIHD